jgi:hypothetical protein
MTDNVTAVRTKIDWSTLSGVILEGGYELKEVLEGRETAARLRVRILGSGGKTGVAYFMHLAPADAEDQLDIWNTLREAPHPNLSKPAALGKRDVGAVKTIYLVLTDPDERLAAVIPERPLEWEEAAEVLHACEKGLAHLHAHGLLHGAVSPQTVEAVGYSVQLSTENVHRVGQTPRIEWQKPQYLAPESKNLNLTTAADVWCLGATLFEVLSQERYGTAGAQLEQGLPLAAVIYRCLDKNPLTRCTLKEAPVIEQNSAQAPPAAKPEPVPTPQPAAPPSAAPPPMAAAPPPAPAAPPPPQPAESKSAPAYSPTTPPPPPIPPRGSPTTATRITSSSRLPQPLTPKEPPKQVTKEDMALVPIGKRHKKVQRQPVGARIRTLDGPDQDHPVGEAISTVLGPAVSARITALGHKSTLFRNIGAVAGLAAILAAAVWFIVLPKLKSIDEPLTSAAPVQISNDSVTLAPDGKPAPVPLQTADPSSPAPAPANNATPDDTPAPPKHYVGYRVVLGAFNSREDALHELAQLSQQHPELILHIVKMSVESANNQIKTVVTVGGTLDQSEAQPLLDRCLKKGLKSAHLERVQIEPRQR